jgi:GDP-4-dehydro-6-deoxy-D-mannose reductase
VVFGIGGFSGLHFEEFIASTGYAMNYRFVGFGRDPARAANTGAFSYRQGDVTEAQQVREFLAEAAPAYILNLVGVLQAESLDHFMAINVGVSSNICESLLQVRAPLEKVVLIGSAAEYGSKVSNPVGENADARPINPYGLSKLYQTLLARYYFENYGLPIVVARTFNILGEGISPALSIGSFIHQISSLRDGGVIKVGNISTSRDFLQVSEVSRRYWNLLHRGTPGEVYNVCSGVPRTIRSVLEEVIAATGKRVQIVVDPARYRANDVASIYGDTTKYDQIMR